MFIYTYLCVLCPFGDRGEEPRSIGAKLLMAYFPEEPLGFRGFREPLGTPKVRRHY